MADAVARWLDRLGLGKYAGLFAEHEIGLDVLPHLSEADLEKLGLPMGARKKVLAAIETVSKAVPEASGTSPEIGSTVRAAAERRQLTVLFCDLVGSTTLSSRLDPEDLRDLLRRYQDAVAGAVTRHDGYVANYLGDGVLAYFGWPRAHEDQAAQAVRAGLAAVAAVAAIAAPDGETLAARVGIASGQVVVGDLEGASTVHVGAVSGETPNLAARLQGLAAAGDVVIGGQLRQLLGRQFVLVDLGKQALKGIAAPMPVWRVTAEAVLESRFEARSAALVGLVGREHELGLLLERWRVSRTGEGQVVLLSGEAGIGKSRLLQELRQRIAGEDHVRLQYQCGPQYANSAFYPVIRQLEQAAGFGSDDGSAARLAKLEALVHGNREAARLLAGLLSVPLEDRDGALDLAPEVRKQRTTQTLIDQLLALAEARQVLFLFEDAHWIDPSSEELLGETVARIAGAPVLMVVTHRPDWRSRWVGQPHVTALSLDRLSRDQAAEIVGAIAGSRVGGEAIGRIVARAEGIPLFVEELTKALLERGLDAAEDDIPATLHASLAARLDRLPPEARKVAQVGAVIGREFDHELLAAVADCSPAALDGALDKLVQAQLVLRIGTEERARFSFKHGLVQDAAYDGLLKRRRQVMHRRVVEAIRRLSPETEATRPELLAHHLTEASLVGEAIDGWLKAGQLAARRSAMHEAVAHLGRALDQLKTLPDDAERRRRELALQLSLGPALVAAKGFAVPETAKVYARACELARQAEDGTAIFAALYGQWVVQFNQQLSAALEIGGELLRLATDREDVAAEVIGHRAAGSTFFKLGRLTEGRGHLERGLALYDPVRDRNSGHVYAYDSSSVCASWLSHALLVMGYPDQARACAAEALAHARVVAHPNTLALTLGCSCSLYQIVRDRQKAQTQAEDAIAITTQNGFPYWLAVATIIRGWTLVEASQDPAGGIGIQQGLNAIRRLGSVTVLPYFLGLSAQAHGKTRQFATGLGLLEEALRWVDGTGESWFLAELHRLRGEMLLASRQPGPAEACFRDAIAAARTQGARWWELRAAVSLARLQSGQGGRLEARELLAPIYEWFTEGVDTPDLVEARALLDDLA